MVSSVEKNVILRCYKIELSNITSRYFYGYLKKLSHPFLSTRTFIFRKRNFQSCKASYWQRKGRSSPEQKRTKFSLNQSNFWNVPSQFLLWPQKLEDWLNKWLKSINEFFNDNYIIFSKLLNSGDLLQVVQIH